MRLQVFHRTEYAYADDVTSNSNELRLTPKITRTQTLVSSLINVLPAARLSHYNDLNFNRVHHFMVPNPHRRLVIESRSVVDTFELFSSNNMPYGFRHRDLACCHDLEDCHPFLQSSSYVEVSPEIWREAVDIRGDSEDVFQTSYAIMDHIYTNYEYVSGATNASTHANDVIAGRKGVCQDFSHAMTAYCRSLGIPARYVSGYFFDSTRDHHMRGSEASHAWVEIFAGESGWVGLDPTNRTIVDENYISLAYGRDYMDVAPVIGSYYGGGASTLSIRVQVDRLD
ncbi:MAG: transglutaminase family protein [Coraliomargarita sp.]